MPSVRIELKLDILPNDKIQIPGCEPLTDVSTTLAQRWKCPNTYVSLKDALDAIPGAKVVDGHNWGLGYRKRWLVLPPIQIRCCIPYTDWYGVLRSLGSGEEPITEKYEACDVIGQGFCPSPGFIDDVGKPKDPYRKEGETPFGYGVTLGPWVPPWQDGDKVVHNPDSYTSSIPPQDAPDARQYGVNDELYDP